LGASAANLLALADASMNSEQTFRLIDQLIPFEVCLYHQVLPLSLEGSRLYLGMVDPEDYSALSYLRQLVGYLNCSLVPKEISLEDHQSLLSAYLNYTSRAQEKKRIASTSIASTAPLDLEESAAQSSPPPTETPLPNTTPELTSTPSGFTDEIVPYQVQTLSIHAQHLASPIEVLAQLSPPQLLQELLGRVFMGGIGRLYFARQADCGRILWSQDGELKSVLENLPLSIFQGSINELKRLTGLPLIPVKRAKQIEIEKFYQKELLLLRFRVTRSSHGEEGTLQVLRGAALKFYQQQKLTNLSQEALIAAQQLQKQIRSMREYCDRNPNLISNPPELVEAIKQILQHVQKEIDSFPRSTEE
jgi:Type II secretion system (T2SS), protein E, N-terminal domain